MFLMTMHRNIFRSFAFRLTLSLALMIGVVSAVGVSLIYLGVFMHLRNVVDVDLQTDLEEFSQNIAIYGHDTEALNDRFVREAKEDGTDVKFLRLVTVSGEVLATSDMASWIPPESPQAFERDLDARGDFLRTIRRGDNRKARIVNGQIGGENFLQIGIALDNDEEFLADFRRIAVFVLLGMLCLGTCIGWWMTRKAMKGIEDITLTTARIAEGNFGDRVHVARYGAEIELLGTTFNRMAERVQALLREMSEVNNSIAHDLRSPITRVHVLAETIAAEKELSARGRDATAGIVENCNQLTHIIDTMLSIAEMGAGAARMEIEEVDLQNVVREALELFQPVAEEKEIALNGETPHTLSVRGDRRRIQRSLANLIDNALKYTDRGGEIVVSLEQSGDEVAIRVRDNGIGIDDRERERIFDRFYRCDRSRTLPGNGLGLSFVQAVSRAFGGDVSVDSTPGKGSTFNFVLPAAGLGSTGSSQAPCP